MNPTDARDTDPDTSHRAAKRSMPRHGSQMSALLSAYGVAPSTGISDDEAAHLAGLLAKPGCCWWKRCSDLRALGLIVDTGLRRDSTLTGESRMVCRITEDGAALLRTWPIAGADPAAAGETVVTERRSSRRDMAERAAARRHR